MPDVGVGLRDHAGWAVAVAVSAEPTVVDRRTIQLCDSRLPRQAYHAAAGLPADRARQLIAEVERSASEAAKTALTQLLQDLQAQGHQLRAVGVCIGTSRIPAELDAILASHALLHAAEGELYREALADAADAAGLPVVRFTNRSLLAEAAAVLDRSPADVGDTINRLGKGLGPPWARDQKEAATAAWYALSSVAGR
jgi:hypothetical protein